MYTDAPNRPQQVAISWQMLLPHDPHSRADEKGLTLGRKRVKAWKNDEWHYIGIIARAVIHIPIGGRSFRVLTLDSAGLWGVESDAGDYLRQCYEEQKAELKGELASLCDALAGNTYHEEESE